MSSSHFVSVQTAKEQFLTRYGEDLMTNESVTIPLPVRHNDRVELLIMVYTATAIYGKPPTPKPPHACARLDIHTGEVKSYGPTTPAALGITNPSAQPWLPVPWAQGTNVVVEVRRLENRLAELSPEVHASFVEGGATSPTVREAAREYFALLRKIIPPSSAPFCDQAAREFFDWLRRTEKGS